MTNAIRAIWSCFATTFTSTRPRAGLIKPADKLAPYRWSSYAAYLQPAKRPAWLRCDHLLGEHGIQEDEVRGRREFARRTESKRVRPGEEGNALAGLAQRGWRIGAEDFADWLAGQLKRRGRRTERASERRETDERLFTRFDQACPGQRLKKGLRLGTQEDVWREIAAMRDVVFDLVSHGGTRSIPPHSLWTLVEQLETQGWLTPCINVLLPVAEAHMEATGAVFVVKGKFNSAELYATPALFRQLWPKLLYAMAVEALVAERAGEGQTASLPMKGEVTAWLAAGHRRGQCVTRTK